MICLIILIVWLTVNCVVDCLNTYRVKRNVASVLGVIARYAAWGFLIYKVAIKF